jgi:hypothetical protein
MSSYDVKLLGSVLGELSPLITEALQALDKPGTRALRRKIDGKFHFAVGVYGMVRRTDDDDVPRSELPHYKRATEVWPARQTVEAQVEARRVAKAAAKAPRLAAVSIDEAPQQDLDADRPRPIGRPQLIVHDGGLLGRRRPSRTSHQGGAA